MEQSLCYSCFQELEPGVRFCPHCGASVEQDWDRHPHALPYGTVLGGRYISGKVLGQGGFGITYLALDHKTGKVAAVKEFFPDTMAGRGQGNSVVPFTGQRGEDFNYGKSTFLEEAKTLAQFSGEPGIVQIYSYFEEYGTAYFAMEYVDGVSLQHYIDEQGGRIGFEDAKRLLLPVMDALGKVHARGIIHRDIKPDNIYIDRSGGVKVLDFGSARYSMGEKSRSLDVVLTHGFAPREQYSRHGRQGAYTDVYALAATFYYAITGRKPPDSIDRMDEDTLALPSSLGAQIPQGEEDVLLRALAVEPQDRFATMAEFRDALLRGDPGTAAGNAGFTSRTGPGYAAGGDAGAAPVPGAPGAPNVFSRTDMSGVQQWTAAPSRTGPVGYGPGGAAGGQSQTGPGGYGPGGKAGAPAAQNDPAQSAPAQTGAASLLQRKKWLLPAGIAGAAAVVLIAVLAVGSSRNNETVTPAPTPASATAAPAGTETEPSATQRPLEVIDVGGVPRPSGTAVPALGGGSLSGGIASLSSGVAGYYPITSVTGGGVTMDPYGMAAEGSGMDTMYIILHDEKHGDMYFDGESEPITLDGSHMEIDGVSVPYTLRDGVLTLVTDVEGIEMTMVFTYSTEKPPAGTVSGSAGGTGGENGARSGTCGDNVRWELADRTLTLSGSGPTYDYVYVEEIPWIDYVEDVDFVVIQNGVTRIGEGLFYTCEMVDVEIPGSVETIGAYAFLNCPYLFDITIPSSVKGLGNAVLSGCENLESVVIESPSIAIWEDAFVNDSELESVTFTGSIERIENDAFYNCNTTIYYPAGDPSWNPIVGHDYGGTLTWAPTGNVTAASAGSRFFAEKYSVALPASWSGRYTVDVHGDNLSVYHTDSAATGYGGHLFTFALFQSYPEYAAIPSYDVAGTLTGEGGEYTVVVIYPSDVQFSAEYQEQYLEMLNHAQYAMQYLAGENGYTFRAR